VPKGLFTRHFLPVRSLTLRFALPHTASLQSRSLRDEMGRSTLGDVMCAAHLGRGQLSSTGAAERLPSPSFCELVDQYARLDERRQFPRLPLSLTVNIRRVGDKLQPEPLRVSTANISCSGLLLVVDHTLAPGTPLDLEVVMADHPLGGPSLRMFSRAHVVRQSPAGRLGWTAVAAVFDDISFDRDPAS